MSFAKSSFSRVVLCVLWLALLPAVQGAEAFRLVLTPLGDSISLPKRILGMSAEPLIEHLIDDPRKVNLAREMDLAYVRFPGGSQSNFYNWRTGLLDFHANEFSSSYVKFWASVAPKIAVAHPSGIHMHEYRKFAESIGAETILLPNLETSSMAEQLEWFKQMHADGDVPTHIELGNEFYLGMMNDPDSMKHWPDEPTTEKVMKAYRDVLAPYCPEGTKFAIQSAASAYWVDSQEADRPFFRRQTSWDENLHSEPWFDAVTVHLYAEPVTVLGMRRGSRPDLTDDLRMRLFQGIMGRVDAGTDRVLNDVAARLPGKEIWITEWNPRGGNPRNLEWEPLTAAMKMQFAVRQTLAILRHPEVKASLYFMLNFSSPVFAEFIPDGREGFSPTGTAIALQWLDEAANGGATFRRYVEAASIPRPSGGVIPESYREIEAGLFQGPDTVTLIIQNASAQARLYNPTQASRGKNPPDRVEVVSIPQLLDPNSNTPVLQSDDPNGDIVIPAFSIVRMIWK